MSKNKRNSESGSNFFAKALIGIAGAAIGAGAYYLMSSSSSQKIEEKEVERITIDKKPSYEQQPNIKVKEIKNPINSNNQIKNTDTDYEEIVESFLCPISLEIMKDPVITPDGISFDRESIVDWLKDHDTCPITKRPLSVSNLTSNKILKSIIENYLKNKNK